MLVKKINKKIFFIKKIESINLNSGNKYIYIYVQNKHNGLAKIVFLLNKQFL